MSESRTEHLSAMEVAAYVDGNTAADARHKIHAHLSECRECRDEIVDAARLAGARTKRGSMQLWIPAVLAAALVLVFVRPESRPSGGETREASVTTTVLPQALTPAGVVDSLTTLRWTSVPKADGYRARVFDGDGRTLLDAVTDDTTLSVPATVAIRPGAVYQWKVDAQMAFDRTAASDLIRFSVRFQRRE